VTDRVPAAQVAGIRDARRLFPATAGRAYFNTAAIGNRAALAVFDDFGPAAIYARNRELTARLRAALAGAGWDPAGQPGQDQSTIVSVPLGAAEASRLLGALSGRGVICSARDGNLRIAVHFYNHEDDIERLVTALAEARQGAG